MTTAATSLLGLALPVTGELSGTWGDTVNNSITSLLDTAVAGTTTLSTDADVTLTTTTLASNQARQAILLCSGARTALRTITAPAQSKIYTIINATTGGYSVKLVGVGPTTGLTIPNGASAVVAWNGSDFIEVGSATVGNLTVNGNLSVTGTTSLTGVATLTANPVLSAGTANGVAYLNGSKVVTTGSALTFDGNRLTVSSTTPSIRIDDTNATGPFGVDWYFSGAGGITRANISLDGSTGEMQFQSGASGSSGWFQTFVLSGSEQMRLTSTGLGIGLGGGSPAFKLDVTSAASYAPIRITSAAGTTLRIDTTRNFTTNRNWIIGCDYTAEGTFAIIPSTALGGSTFTNPAYLITTSGEQRWYNGATQAMTLDASGNLGVGETSPGNKLSLKYSATDFGASILINNSASLAGSVASTKYVNAGSSTGLVIGKHASGFSEANLAFINQETNAPLAFFTNNTERARIDSSGNLVVNSSVNTAPLNTNAKISVWNTAGDAKGIATGYGTANGEFRLIYLTSGNGALNFDSGTNNATLSSAGAWTNASDARLKKNIVDIKYGLSDVLKTQPRSYKMNDVEGEYIGFVAQELQTVIPEVVSGDPEKQLGVDYGSLVALAFKAIQEQQAIIDTLTARITALEGQ